jgi:hypothetical protein
MIAECTHILPTGKKCLQFALCGQPYCRPHMDPERRRHSEALHYLVDGIATLDLDALLEALIGLVEARRRKQIPPSHANAAFVAALDRLEVLRAGIDPEMAPEPATPSATNTSRGVQWNQTLPAARL